MSYILIHQTATRTHPFCPVIAVLIAGPFKIIFRQGSVIIPLPELLVEKSVGETLPADTDSLQHTVAPQLVEDKVGIN